MTINQNRFPQYIVLLLLLSFGLLLNVSFTTTQEMNLPTFTDSPEAQGESLILYGQVLNQAGNPIGGATVEIWQTDTDGVYDHPNAPTDNMDANFQHFGSSTTDENGMYIFRTVKPAAEFGNRPLHIHFKVRIDGEDVLTSQFYFVEDSAGNQPEIILLNPEDMTDEDGNAYLLAMKNIVVQTVESGSLELTPNQTEGPFYPVVNVSEYDNDLMVVSDQDMTMTTATTFSLLNLNTATGDEFGTIPDVGGRMIREFEEYRPYISIVQFRREIGKYVDQEQVAAYEAYVYVPIQVNDSDAETLKQIPGIDDIVATELMALRPFESNEAFLDALGEIVRGIDLVYAANFLVTE